VIDGDTIRLASGERVRLVQIDAPEERDGECYAGEATAELERLVPPGTRVRIETDPALDEVDRYDRVLAYVYKGNENVNLTLFVRGAASVWFYRGARGRYADDLLQAAEKAQAAGRGLWGACEARLDPLSSVSTRPRSAGGGSTATGEWCAGAIDWQAARAGVGEAVRVRAPVVRAHYARTSNGRPTFVDLGRGYPDPGRLTVLIWGRSRANFPSAPEEMFPPGEPICVEGTVSTHRGVAQIQVARWDPDGRLLAP
jgi:endonuclease YncB( thermonuclease family)